MAEENYTKLYLNDTIGDIGFKQCTASILQNLRKTT